MACFRASSWRRPILSLTVFSLGSGSITNCIGILLRRISSSLTPGTFLEVLGIGIVAALALLVSITAVVLSSDQVSLFVRLCRFTFVSCHHRFLAYSGSLTHLRSLRGCLFTSLIVLCHLPYCSSKVTLILLIHFLILPHSLIVIAPLGSWLSHHHGLCTASLVVYK